jgi:K(+)-stimulated pyrophosphate-energized sodium pump
VRHVAQASTTGHATNIIAGIGVSMKATACRCFRCASPSSFYALAGLYGIAIAATAMLSVAGDVDALDAYGRLPTTRAALPRWRSCPTRCVRSPILWTPSATPPGGDRGYAIGSAGLAALGLRRLHARARVRGQAVSFDLNHYVIIGLFIGG